MPGYRAFFPTGSEAHGHLPVWGFAQTTSSTCEKLPPGERLAVDSNLSRTSEPTGSHKEKPMKTIRASSIDV